MTINNPMISAADLPAELKEKFEGFMDEIDALIRNGEIREEASRHLLKRIQKEAVDHPILTRVVSAKMENSRMAWSLLIAACGRTHSPDAGCDVIKNLIVMNPRALVFRWEGRHGYNTPLEAIGINSSYCELLPWIAEHFAWAFDHPNSIKYPPHLHMLSHHAFGRCSANAVRNFYEIYPQGLRQGNHGITWTAIPFPIYACLAHAYYGTFDADLFEWMAEKCPEAIVTLGNFGKTLLYHACDVISTSMPNYMFGRRRNPLNCEGIARICHYLISKYPEAVRIPYEMGIRVREHEGFPLHCLVRRCNRPFIQDLVIRQLKLYPEVVEVPRYSPRLSFVPFIQRVQPLLQQDAKIEEESAWLSKACTHLHDIHLTGGQNNEVHPIHAACVVFTSWATDSLAVHFPAMRAKIQRQIDQVKAEFEGEDEY